MGAAVGLDEYFSLARHVSLGVCVLKHAVRNLVAGVLALDHFSFFVKVILSFDEGLSSHLFI